MVHIGDILYALYGATSGEVSRAKLDGAINQAILAIIPNDEVNADFLVEWFRKEKAQITDKYIQGGQGNLSAQIIKDLKVTIPMREEQNKIGEYFSKVNHLITLHQRILVKFVEKLASVWEQRKLGEVFKEYSEKNHTELPALTIIQGGGTVKREESDRNLMYDESNLSNYKMVRKNDFIVHLRSFEGGLEKSSLDGIISPAYHTFHSDVADSRFYYPYFRSHEFIKHKLVPHVYGIRDGRSIDIAGMKTIEIPYTSIEEQRKIGDYLESLDHLITLHHRKYKNLHKISLNDWEQRKLGDIADVIKLAGFEFTEHVVYSDEGNIIALRGLNIKNGQLILDDVKYIDGSNFSKLSRSKLFIDDIMFTYVGTVGEVAIIKENDRFYLAPNVSRIRVKSDDSPKFISHYMRTDN